MPSALENLGPSFKARLAKLYDELAATYRAAGPEFATPALVAEKQAEWFRNYKPFNGETA